MVPLLPPENWLHIVAIVEKLTPNYRYTLRIHSVLDQKWNENSLMPIYAGLKYTIFRSSFLKNRQMEVESRKG
jgi:hypothetical protein